MKTAFAHRMATGLRLALLALAAPALLACSDAPSEDSGVSFTTGALQRQLGFREDPGTSTLVGPVDSESTTLARSVVVGSVVIRSRSIADGPYGDRTVIADIRAQLEADIRDSLNLLKLFNLPVADSAVKIEIPPPGADKWQIMAAALSTQPTDLEDLADTVHQNAVVFIGFAADLLGNAVFLKTSGSGEIFILDAAGNPTGGPVTGLTLTMKRACLINQVNVPKGCAQFIPGVLANPIISSALEVYSVEVDGTPVAPTFPAYPFIVRATPDVGSEVNAATAATSIGPLFDPVGLGHLSVEVFTTHMLSPNQDPVCALLDNNAPTVAALTLPANNCTFESYFTPGN